MPRRLHSQEGASAGDPAPADVEEGDFSKVLVARGSVHRPLGALESMLSARANQMLHVEEEAQGRAPGRLPGPLSTHSWDPSLLRFQGLESSPCQGDGRG